MKNNQIQNEDTILNEKTTKNNLQQNEVKKAPEKKGRKILWQDVLVGGVPGVVLGAAGMMITTSATAAPDGVGTETAEDGTGEITVTEVMIHETAPLATSVNDDMSFNEAFSAARAEVGAGGVFMWHGNAYSTYNQDEWESMTPEQKAEYSSSITSVMTNHDDANGTHTIDEPEIIPEPEPTPEPAHGDVDIRVQEVGFVETGDGDEVFVAVAQIDGHDAIFMDQDLDGVVDYLIVDINDDGDVQEQEIIDVHESGLTDVELTTAANLDAPMPEDDLYAMGPDYTNDANIDSLA